MAIYTHHPKRVKDCVFCKFWIGDAGMRFVNSAVGYEYEASVKGKCTKRNNSATPGLLLLPQLCPRPAGRETAVISSLILIQDRLSVLIAGEVTL